ARAARGRDDPPRAGPHGGGPPARRARGPRPALVPAAGARGARGRRRGPAGRAPGPPRQVPDLGARGGRLPARPPADDRDAALRRRAGPALPPGHLRPRRRARGGVLRPPAVRDGRAVGGPGGARRLLRAAARRRAAGARGAHRPAAARAGPRCPRPGEGLPARPAADRRGGEHLRRRGAVPCGDPSAAPGGGAEAGAVRGARGGGGRRAARRPGRGRRHHRRLPAPGRGVGRLPARVPRAPAPRRAVRLVRRGDRQARGSGAGDVRLRAVPAATAAAPLRDGAM
ncbi:MAG: Formamidopyrimidine-DNA glycosylase, partial [uncultured Solirubrobacteraceae bacterium]